MTVETLDAPAVRLGADGPDRLLLDEVATACAAAAGGPLEGLLEQARALGEVAPLPGAGRTALRWELLATAAAVDLSLARTAEAHLDALAVLAEAGTAAPPGSTWGVYAAEAPGLRVDARPAPDHPGRWSLTGTKPWCSLAGSLTHALVTAATPGGRRLFALDLRGPGVAPHGPGAWVSRGLAGVPSTPVDLRGALADPVGDDGWYLRRDGFAWGGAGVAACWYGGAVGLARRLRASADPSSPGGREPDQVALVHLGGVDAALAAARACLAQAARDVDAGRAGGQDGAVLAHRVRAVVAAAAEEVLQRVGHALGPGPLTQEEEHARRVADLGVYLRQHHAERDLAALGAAVAAGSADAGRAW